MSQDSMHLERAIALCHQASADPAAWRDVLRMVCDGWGAPGAALFEPGLDPELRRFRVTWGSMQSGVPEYFGYWAEFDPWTCAVAGTGFFEVAGEVRLGCEFLDDAALLRTAYFNEHGRHHGSGHKLSLKVCDADDQCAPVTNLVLTRPLHEAGFDDFDKQRMRILWPHLRRAVQTNSLLQRARELPRAAGAALDALPLATWVLRADATMEYANLAARALEPSAIWRSDHRRRLSALGDLDAAAIVETASLATAGAARILALDGESGPRRAILRTAPVGEVALYVSAWPRAQVLFMLEMPFAQAEQQWLRTLCAKLHLTPAESRVLEQLAAGMTADQIAATQSVNVTTVRTHLRALFAKSGRNRQSELVRLALGR